MRYAFCGLLFATAIPALGESASFAPKWRSDDGRSLALVFSGQDSFSTRDVKIVLRQ